VGYVESGLTTSYEMLVSMNEVIGLVKHFIGGVPVNKETLALDVIDRVGPGGHFLAEWHTVRHCRENWRTTLFDRDNREGWESKGQLTHGERATVRVRTLLETHSPEPLAGSVLSELQEIIDQAQG
jgi:trimethylamine--corrinoid protein Co-methyltransferase